MQKKQLITLVSLVVVIFAVIGFAMTYLIKFLEPQIIINASIKAITQEDYKRLQERRDIDLSKYGIDKFKHINITFEFEQPLFIINDRNIDAEFITDVDKIFMNNERIIDLSGGGFTQDNKSERLAIYQRNNEILLNNTSENEIVNLFKDMKVKVKWNKVLKGEEERVYYIKDYLKIVN